MCRVASGPILLAAAIWSLPLLLALPAAAQDLVPSCQVRGSREWLSTRASPLDSATVVVAGRTAKVCYSRPSARGRVVFGELVEYGKLWRTGANEPTVLHLTFAAQIAGIPLEPGRYLLFTAPRPEEWTIAIFASDAEDAVEMFQTMRPMGQGPARVEALADPVETFTMRGVDGATEGGLLLEWERVRVRIPIRPIP